MATNAGAEFRQAQHTYRLFKRRWQHRGWRGDTSALMLARTRRSKRALYARLPELWEEYEAADLGGNLDVLKAMMAHGWLAPQTTDDLFRTSLTSGSQFPMCSMECCRFNCTKDTVSSNSDNSPGAGSWPH